MAQDNFGSENYSGGQEHIIADLMKDGTALFNKVREMDLDWKTLVGAVAAISVIGGVAVYFFSDKKGSSSSQLLSGLKDLTAGASNKSKKAAPSRGRRTNA